MEKTAKKQADIQSTRTKIIMPWEGFVKPITI